MKIYFSCKQCYHALKADSTLAQTRMTCPKCSAENVVPRESTREPIRRKSPSTGSNNGPIVLIASVGGIITLVFAGWLLQRQIGTAADNAANTVSQTTTEIKDSISETLAQKPAASGALDELRRVLDSWLFEQVSSKQSKRVQRPLEILTSTVCGYEIKHMVRQDETRYLAAIYADIIVEKKLANGTINIPETVVFSSYVIWNPKTKKWFVSDYPKILNDDLKK